MKNSILTAAPAFPSFSVDDLATARTFYRDTLGLDVVDRPEGLELEVGAGSKVFVYPKPDHKPATFTILNFPVDDVELAVDKLNSTGVRFEKYDLPDIKTDDRGIMRGADGPAMAWFKDPAGNILSVLQERAD
jgi:catechol 2,3-dioxygenase-like lactoylglutathione lyase family enzyme